jgi:hypothetical protein
MDKNKLSKKNEDVEEEEDYDTFNDYWILIPITNICLNIGGLMLVIVKDKINF